MNALPVRAYNMIYNNYYRDDDLISEVNQDQTTILNCAWAKDYFTAARTSPQAGSAVSLPLGTSAPVHVPDATAIDVYADSATAYYNLNSGASPHRS